MLAYLNASTYPEARRALFRRVQLLYECDIYGDYVEVLHALLLMSFYYDDPEEIKGAWYYLGAEITFAHQLGLPEKAISGHSDYRLYKRLWWSAYIRDALISLGLRLPSRLNHTMPMLELDDFISESSSNSSMSDATRDMALICIQMAKLCVCINSMVTSKYLSKTKPPQAVLDACDRDLTAWHQSCFIDCPWLASRAVANDPNRGVSVARLLTAMTYHTLVYVLYLPYLPQGTTYEASGGPTESMTDRGYRKVQGAAHEVSVLAKVLLDHDLVRSTPTQGFV